VGFLEQKHIHVSEIVCIGKEANNIKDEPNLQVFRNQEKDQRKIGEMLQCGAEKLWINRETRWRMKHKKIFKKIQR
jgi:hypothetical protein